MKKVAIIGGGITGLVAAWELSKSFQVTVFEKEQEIGGLLSQIDFDGEKIDAFYHHFFKGDDELINLYKKLELKEEIIFYPSSVAILKEGRFYPLNRPLDVLFLPFISFLGKLRLGLGAFIFSRTDWRRVEEKTAKEVAIRLMGKEGWEKIWSVLFKSKFSNLSDRISAAWFWARIASRLPSRESGKEVLGYPKSGFGYLLERLREEIVKNGGEIITGQGVGEDIKGYDIVLNTAIQKGECLGVICVILRTKNQLPFYWINVFEDAHFMAAISQKALVPSSPNIIYLPIYTATDGEFFKLSDQEIEHIFVSEFCRIFNWHEKEIRGVKVTRATKAQPVIFPGYKIPSHKPKANLYRTSMAHIYPYDRGLNYAVKEAGKIVSLIKKDLGIE